jgi:KDO2-lipid IV(A) lauroyltransferase
MRNPLVEKWIQARRTEGGNRIALHRDAVRATLKWLKQKNIAGILADQNLYTGGTFVQFFNRPAATTTLPTLLHARTGAPVIFIYSLRKGSKFVIHYTARLSLPEGGDTESQLQNGTQIISDEMENLIRKYPENWFWIHNRWKRQP